MHSSWTSMHGVLIAAFLFCSFAATASQPAHHTTFDASLQNLGEPNASDAISAALKYAGALYLAWDGESIGPGKPFYAYDGDDVSPTTVKAGGINCAGLINAVRLSLSLPLPTLSAAGSYPGGTYYWGLLLASALRPIVDGQPPPMGSVLLRHYNNTEDQGHLGVVSEVEQGGSFMIIHAFSSTPLDLIPPGELVEPGVVEEAYQRSMARKLFPFTHYAPPAAWLRRAAQSDRSRVV